MPLHPDSTKGNEMTINVTPPDSATQRATWTHQATEGTYSAAVTRTSRTDRAGRHAWAWELAFSPADGVGFRYTGAADTDAIYAHGSDPVDVLHTLAVFVSAWDEAQRYPDSENADLFPQACAPFLGAAETFDIDTDRD